MSVIRTIVLFSLILLPKFVLSQIKPAFLTDYNKDWVESIFSSMSLDEKIGQLMMPRGNYSGKPHEVEKLKQWIIDYKIGGIVFFASNPSTQARLTNELQEISKIPLMIGQDLEWGLGMRLDSTDRFPYGITIGAMEGDDALIESMGEEIARQCKRIGVHINYAPVVDVNNNPNNPVINFRSFGSDKNKVASKGLAFMKGMQSGNILCTAKHFPGHGDTEVDSHHDLPLITHQIDRLKEVELYPFDVLIKNGLSGIMTAHLSIPALENQEGLASTFSKNIVQKLLKEDMLFQGLTFTDAMEMQGAVKNFPKGEAMVQALLAGNDVLETFMDVPTAFNTIKKAILDHRIPLGMIDSKVKKILMAKSWLGLENYRHIAMDGLLEDLNSIQSDVINQKIIEKSITCLKNDLNVLPIKNLNQKIAVLSIESEYPESTFYKMATRYCNPDLFYIPKAASQILIDSILHLVEKYDVVLANMHLIDIRASKNYGLTTSNTKLIVDLVDKSNVVFCLFGNPFILNKIPELARCKTFVLGYQQNDYTERATCQVLFGALSPKGRLPITINEIFKYGTGIEYSTLGRLTYGLPEQVGIDRVALASGIDSIVYLGLKEKAFPGAVVQVAKDGKVIFSKSYGNHIYEVAENSFVENKSVDVAYSFINDAMDNPENLKTTLRPKVVPSKRKGKVDIDDIYDLASISKITTSTLAVMQMMSKNKLNLEDKLSKYFPAFDGSDKGQLIIRNLLTHQSGLEAWIPFWRDAIDTTATLLKALEKSPNLEEYFIVKWHKPGFFKRLFGKKTTKEILWVESLQKNPNLWENTLNSSNLAWKKDVFSNQPSSIFNVKIKDSLYLNANQRNKIYDRIKTAKLNAQKNYVYSDLHFYLYPSIVKSLMNKSFETFLDETYQSIGAFTLGFNPLDKFNKDKIVPTEYDSLFRKGIIHGYVHDEGAAMMGGVSGHAGLFGNANDLTKIMQMFLQKGSYGGTEYIKSSVVDTCTKYQFLPFNNRRGIGFDKKDTNPNIKNAPSLSSESSYGHSGYTGTYTWVDPKYNLVYVFLSNRVYPSRTNTIISTLNIRPAIGDHIIKCIKKP